MYVVGVGLLKVYKALIRLWGGGTLHPPSDVCVRSFLCSFFCNKISATHAQEEESLRILANVCKENHT